MKRVADHFGIKYYRRRAELASDDTTNDEFALDFIENVVAIICINIVLHHY